ncbi:MAG: PAS domain-containing sensor histidine kinase [Clostridiales bacterium]|nr:PAS domain-containing sensor histidine kinase [Clostridiales bacterium]
MIRGKHDKYIGIVLTAFAIILFCNSSISYKPSTLMVVFSMLIMFTIYKGGMLSGVVSGLMSIIFMNYIRSNSAINSALIHLSDYEFAINIASIICMAVLAAVMDYRYRSYYEKFMEGQTLISRAEEISEIMTSHISVEGKFIKVPQRLCYLLGYTEEELLNMYWWDVTDLDDALREEELAKEIIKGNRETYNIEKKLRKKNLDTVWVFCNVSAVRNDDGEVIHMLKYMVNITERIIMSQELKKNESRYRNLVELDPDPVVIHEGDIITFINNSGVKMLKASSKEEVIGRSLYEFVHPDYIYNMRNQVGRALINLNYGGNPFEVKLCNLEGEEIDVEIVNVGFMSENSVQVMAIIRDITERKKTEELKAIMKENERQLEEAKEYDRIKNEFFSNISHEFRTPINVILGTLQLIEIQNQKEGKKSDKYTNIMKQNCYRLLRMVNNLIDITKIDSGYYDMNMGCYDIVKIVENIALSAAQYVQGKRLLLEFDTDIEEKNICCDPDQIERIMHNLISNAIKFTKPGGRISIYIKDKGNSVVIGVKDTGIGIPKEKQHIIFERFRQIDKSLTREHEGSGIGLSLVKSLVELHKGNISLISEPGCGSEFIIELPVDNKDVYSYKASDAENRKKIEKMNIEFSDIYF